MLIIDKKNRERVRRAGGLFRVYGGMVAAGQDDNSK